MGQLKNRITWCIHGIRKPQLLDKPADEWGSYFGFLPLPTDRPAFSEAGKGRLFCFPKLLKDPTLGSLILICRLAPMCANTFKKNELQMALTHVFQHVVKNPRILNRVFDLFSKA
jgi:hypothetical protein